MLIHDHGRGRLKLKYPACKVNRGKTSEALLNLFLAGFQSPLSSNIDKGVSKNWLIRLSLHFSNTSRLSQNCVHKKASAVTPVPVFKQLALFLVNF